MSEVTQPVLGKIFDDVLGFNPPKPPQMPTMPTIQDQQKTADVASYEKGIQQSQIAAATAGGTLKGDYRTRVGNDPNAPKKSLLGM